MKKFFAISIILLLSSCFRDWSYEGSTGPKHWGDLKEDYKFCKIGYNQSPIDITFPAIENGKDYELKFSYHPSEVEKEQQSQNVKFSFFSKDFVTFLKRDYFLQKIYFHHPSEHLVKGEQQILEMHIFHKSENEQSLALAIFVKVGKENAEFNKMIDLLDNNKKGAVAKINLAKIVKKEDKFFFYDGSKTTPPCKEGVKWFVMKTQIEMSKEQINKIINLGLKGKANARPVQKFAPEKY